MSATFFFSPGPDGANISPPPGFSSKKPKLESEYDPPQGPTSRSGSKNTDSDTRYKLVGGIVPPNQPSASDFLISSTAVHIIKSEQPSEPDHDETTQPPTAATTPEPAAASDLDGANQSSPLAAAIITKSKPGTAALAKQSSAAAPTPTKSFVCLTCDRGFKGPQGLASHMLTHRPRPPTTPAKSYRNLQGPQGLGSYMLTPNSRTTRAKKKILEQANQREAQDSRERAMEESILRTGRVGECSYGGGDSNLQSEIGIVSETLLNEAFARLDLEILSLSNTVRAADLCCPIGPDSFRFANYVVSSVKFLYDSEGLSSQMPEFEVYFNVQKPNDFNKLSKSLPQNGRYYAAAVPGSLYGRLFPKASIQIVHLSHSLDWLSKVPEDVIDKNSPAWNKGRIHYSNSSEAVVRAYEAQHAEDMECFLRARAQEIVNGGLMLLTILGRPNGTPHSHCSASVTYQILGSCLMDMARKGVVGAEEVDAFNIRVYYMSPQEFEAAVDRNGCFSLEKMETLPQLPALDKSSQLIASQVRAATEQLFTEQFGEEILDELFQLYRTKIEELPSILESGKAINFLIVLKRKAD